MKHRATRTGPVPSGIALDGCVTAMGKSDPNAFSEVAGPLRADETRPAAEDFMIVAFEVQA